MFKLPNIDFSKSSFLSAETIEFHYGGHYSKYMDRLNKMLEEVPAVNLLEVVYKSDGVLFNNAAQVWNHTFYWLCLTPGSTKLRIDSELNLLIEKQYGSFDVLKDFFISQAQTLFGSGWVWLALNFENKNLEIINTRDAEVIDFKTYKPLLICDVWEHAYYIEYRNSRKNYLEDFWNSINWDAIVENYDGGLFKKIENAVEKKS